MFWFDSIPLLSVYVWWVVQRLFLNADCYSKGPQTQIHFMPNFFSSMHARIILFCTYWSFHKRKQHAFPATVNSYISPHFRILFLIYYSQIKWFWYKLYLKFLDMSLPSYTSQFEFTHFLYSELKLHYLIARTKCFFLSIHFPYTLIIDSNVTFHTLIILLLYLLNLTIWQYDL